MKSTRSSRTESSGSSSAHDRRTAGPICPRRPLLRPRASAMVACEGQSADSAPGTGSSPNIMRTADCTDPFFPLWPDAGRSAETNRSRSRRDGLATDSPSVSTTVGARSGIAVARPVAASSSPNRVRIAARSWIMRRRTRGLMRRALFTCIGETSASWRTVDTPRRSRAEVTFGLAPRETIGSPIDNASGNAKLMPVSSSPAEPVTVSDSSPSKTRCHD